MLVKIADRQDSMKHEEMLQTMASFYVCWVM